MVWIPVIPENDSGIGILKGTRKEFQTTGPQTTHLPLVDLNNPTSSWANRDKAMILS